MSHDGRYVAFDSLARLSPTDTDMVGDVYVRDRKAGKTKLVTVTSSGKPREKVDAALPALSADGKWVAFASAGPLRRERPQQGERHLRARAAVLAARTDGALSGRAACP